MGDSQQERTFPTTRLLTRLLEKVWFCSPRLPRLPASLFSFPFQGEKGSSPPGGAFDRFSRVGKSRPSEPMKFLITGSDERARGRGGRGEAEKHERARPKLCPSPQKRTPDYAFSVPSKRSNLGLSDPRIQYFSAKAPHIDPAPIGGTQRARARFLREKPVRATTRGIEIWIQKQQLFN